MLATKENLAKYSHLIEGLYEYCKMKLNFPLDAELVFIENKNNSENPLGRTAYYSPAEKKVAIYITNRHVKDVLRSIAHELVHHSQNCRDSFSHIDENPIDYAQKDGHLREMEREAYEVGNMLFRDFEDGIKTGKITIIGDAE